MEPNSINQNISELPQPEQTGDHFAYEQPKVSHEMHGVAQPPMPAQPGPVVANPAAPYSAPASYVPPVNNSQLTQQLIADDADLIEKEWVLKAKAIVMHTKDDPHKQNLEMNKVKADYLKKRYNKDLKINES